MADAPHIGLDESLAVELDRAGRDLEDLGVTLCLDPVVVQRHSAPLQRFDEVRQVLGEIAAVLRRRGTDHDALQAIRLAAMRERMIDARE